jgi:hypothetical protein
MEVYSIERRLSHCEINKHVFRISFLLAGLFSNERIIESGNFREPVVAKHL